MKIWIVLLFLDSERLNCEKKMWKFGLIICDLIYGVNLDIICFGLVFGFLVWNL